jgi:hypothetical protein
MSYPNQTNPEIVAFFDEIEKGYYSNTKLRQLYGAIMSAGGFSIYSFGNEFDADVILCSVCDLPAFVSTTLSAYKDAYWVCDTCKDQFSFCKECGTYVLTNDIDNPTHRHDVFARSQVGMAVYPDPGEKAVWNADIMTSKKGQLFHKTHEEQLIAKRMRENHMKENFRYFGVELEVERIPAAPPDLLLRVYGQLSENFVMVKHDGSLSNKGKGGFEIVSVPATLKYHKSGVWDGFYRNLGNFFVPSPPTTGLHIHVGIDSVGKLTAGKMLLFINSAKNREFVERIAQRHLGVTSPNGKIYAGIKDDWHLSDVLKLKQHEPGCPWDSATRKVLNRYKMNASGHVLADTVGNPIIDSLEGKTIHVRPVCRCSPGVYKFQKYEAFNLSTKRPTVELRLFRGIVSHFFLMVALEFADALADFCSITPPSKLSYRDFLAWMCQFNPSGMNELYPSLSRHLINESWIDPPKSAPELEGGLP